ncbi:MAG: hypothetical protein DWQ07_18735 [Chloroflexi bacterium]|nr:MAG: hypothetical protein DWQ07_18735 [Chloroflexota bacterium]MBL1194969.1 hypothetical protein [Chloroflexota bacterium]
MIQRSRLDLIIMPLDPTMIMILLVDISTDDKMRFIALRNCWRIWQTLSQKAFLLCPNNNRERAASIIQAT